MYTYHSVNYDSDNLSNFSLRVRYNCINNLFVIIFRYVYVDYKIEIRKRVRTILPHY